jgi:hypothetical protein
MNKDIPTDIHRKVQWFKLGEFIDGNHISSSYELSIVQYGLRT